MNKSKSPTGPEECEPVRVAEKDGHEETAREETGEGMHCFTYILRCSDGSLYTGWTNDLMHRLAAHNSGSGARYTRSRRPVTLVYYEAFATKHEAMSREVRIKQLTRAEKEELIRCAREEEKTQGEK